MTVRESNAFLCKGKEENLVDDDQGWTLVTRRKGKKKGKILQARPPAPLILRMKAIDLLPFKDTKTSPKPKRPAKEKKKKSIKPSVYAQKARTPITLNEFMPRQFRLSTEVPLTCYQVKKEKESVIGDTDVEIQTPSQNSSFHSCATKITFSDDDLLLGSKSHNRPLYTTGFV